MQEISRRKMLLTAAAGSVGSGCLMCRRMRRTQQRPGYGFGEKPDDDRGKARYDADRRTEVLGAPFNLRSPGTR